MFAWCYIDQDNSFINFPTDLASIGYLPLLFRSVGTTFCMSFQNECLRGVSFVITRVLLRKSLIIRNIFIYAIIEKDYMRM